MGVFVRASVRNLSFEFGLRSAWRGACELTVSEPEIRAGDAWPSRRQANLDLSLEFHEKTSSLDEILETTGADAFQQLATEKGYTNAEHDLACMTYFSFRETTHVRVAIILAPEKFGRVSDLLHLYSETGRRIATSFSFVGFRTDRFDETVRPTLQEFENGAPYLVREKLGLTLLPS